MIKVRTAVILAGGAGIRLRPLTINKPKAMIRVLGKPILEWIIEWLRFNGITNLVIGVAYKKEVIMRYFKDGSEFGMNIKYSIHSVEGETGEAFRLAISRYVNDDVFVAMNGDEITNFSLNKMIDYHIKSNSVATIAIANPQLPYGVIRVNENGVVEEFVEKPVIPSVFVSIGVYVFNRDIIKYLPDKGPIEKTTFPFLAKKKLLTAYKINKKWLTINTIKDLKYAESILKEKVKNGTWLT